MSINRQLTRAEWLELYSDIRANGIAYVIRTNQYSGYDGVLNDIENMLSAENDYLYTRARELKIVNTTSSDLALYIFITLTAPLHIFNRWKASK